MRRVLLFAQCQLSSWSTPGLVASREIYDSIFQSYSTFFLASLKVSLRETTYITNAASQPYFRAGWRLFRPRHDVCKPCQYMRNQRIWHAAALLFKPLEGFTLTLL